MHCHYSLQYFLFKRAPRAISLFSDPLYACYHNIRSPSPPFPSKLVSYTLLSVQNIAYDPSPYLQDSGYIVIPLFFRVLCYCAIALHFGSSLHCWAQLTKKVTSSNFYLNISFKSTSVNR